MDISLIQSVNSFCPHYQLQQDNKFNNNHVYLEFSKALNMEPQIIYWTKIVVSSSTYWILSMTMHTFVKKLAKVCVCLEWVIFLLKLLYS